MYTFKPVLRQLSGAFPSPHVCCWSCLGLAASQTSSHTHWGVICGDISSGVEGNYSNWNVFCERNFSCESRPVTWTDFSFTVHHGSACMRWYVNVMVQCSVGELLGFNDSRVNMRRSWDCIQIFVIWWFKSVFQTNNKTWAYPWKDFASLSY